MKASQAKQLFVESHYGNENDLRKALKKDYLAVQFEWSCFIDSLCRNGDITMTQYQNWLFPWKKGN